MALYPRKSTRKRDREQKMEGRIVRIEEFYLLGLALNRRLDGSQSRFGCCGGKKIFSFPWRPSRSASLYLLKNLDSKSSRIALLIHFI
jgi:hypothetical protein